MSPPRPMAGEPFISFVVPVRNEEQHLAACLISLVNQRYPSDRYEVIVVDGRSTDRTRDIARDFARLGPPDVRLLDNQAVSVAPGRNLGIRAARGSIVAFVEGHARVGPEFLATVLDCFSRTGAECLGRYVDQLIPGDNVIQRATGLSRKTWLGRNPHSGRFVRQQEGWVSPLGVATVYRRDVFDRVGLYDEAFTTNEDVELNYRLERAGVQAWYSPALRYCLHPRDSLGKLLRQMYCYGAGKRRFVSRHPSARRVAYLVPTALCASTLSALVAAPLWPIVAGCLGAAPTLFLALAVARGVAAARQGALVAMTVPLVLATIACGFGLGYAVELGSELCRLGGSRHVAAGYRGSP